MTHRLEASGSLPGLLLIRRLLTFDCACSDHTGGISVLRRFQPASPALTLVINVIGIVCFMQF